jgi:DNA-binding transcriptional MocR family regulator
VKCDGIKMSEGALVAALAERGVMVSPGSFYFPARTKSLGFRLSCVNLREPEIEKGIRRLGRALANLKER